MEDLGGGATVPTVSGRSTWACRASVLSEVLLPVYVCGSTDLTLVDRATSTGVSPVLLEQEADGSQCVLSLRCGPQPPFLIYSLLVTSEARTIEVYSDKGDYCGTGRGERHNGIQPESGDDRGPFYTKHLVLESPSVSCEVKLLSLGGRSSVIVSTIVIGVQPQDSTLRECSPRPGLGLGLGPSINMQEVHSLVQEMGVTLSPGAQNLIEMVNLQQKNQVSALGGFLPFLMGAGAFSALAPGTNGPPATVRNGPHPAGGMPTNASLGLTNAAPPMQNGALQSDELACSSPGAPLPGSTADDSVAQHSKIQRSSSHAQLVDMMSRFLSGQTPGPRSGQASTSDLLPMLQSMCGQVTQLRLDEATACGKEEGKGTWVSDAAMEHRLEEMERRLREHIDRRLDALEQKLEKALLCALPSVALNQGTKAAAATQGGGEGGGEAAPPVGSTGPATT